MESLAYLWSLLVMVAFIWIAPLLYFLDKFNMLVFEQRVASEAPLTYDIFRFANQTIPFSIIFDCCKVNEMWKPVLLGLGGWLFSFLIATIVQLLAEYFGIRRQPNFLAMFKWSKDDVPSADDQTPVKEERDNSNEVKPAQVNLDEGPAKEVTTTACLAPVIAVNTVTEQTVLTSTRPRRIRKQPNRFQ